MIRLFTLLLLAFIIHYPSFSQCATGVFEYEHATYNSHFVEFEALDSAVLCLPTFVAIGYTWDFGDGVVETGFRQLSHLFDEAGIYQVCLTEIVINTQTNEVLAELYSCQEVTILDCLNPSSISVGVISNNDQGSYLEVQGQFINPIVDCQWTFGDVIINTTVPQVFVEDMFGYFIQGQVVITDSEGCVYQKYINEYNPLGSPCEFNIQYFESCWDYYFALNSVTENTSVEWFVDGTLVGSSQYFSYSFGQPGEFEVSSTITDEVAGCQVENTVLVNVLELTEICGYVFHDLNFNSVQDPDESPIQGITIRNIAGEFESVTDANGYYEIQVCQNSLNNLFPDLSATDYLALVTPISDESGAIIIDGDELETGSCIYNFALINPTSTVCGIVFIDANGNDEYDIDEFPIANASVIFPASNLSNDEYIAITNNQGEYCIEIPSYSQMPSCAFTTPMGVELSETKYFWVEHDSTLGGVNFGFHFVENAYDPAIVIGPIFANLWFTNHINPAIRNYGDQPAIVNATVHLDDIIEVDSVGQLNGVDGVYDETTHTVSWNGVVLPPLACFTASISMHITSGTVLGTEFIVNGEVTLVEGTELFELNNSYSCLGKTVSSYDPNNKLSYPLGVGETGDMLPSNNPFTYVINFQNTGTSAAVNIRIEDQLDEDLDWGSIEVLGASHNYFMEMVNGHVTWYFNNIMLPDSNTNEELSHGQIIYRIHPVADKPVGTVFENTAYIYFDFNEAIITNTTMNTFVTEIAVNEVDFNQDVLVYPNPTTGLFRVDANSLNNNDRIVIFDGTGRVVYNKIVSNNGSRDLEINLSSGQYILQIFGEKEVRSAKIVVR